MPVLNNEERIYSLFSVVLLISPAHVLKDHRIDSVGECSYHNITESHIREMLLTRPTRLYTLNST